MKQYDIEDNIISCILQKPKLINELFVDLKCFTNNYNKQIILLIQKVYAETKDFDITYVVNKIENDYNKNYFINYYADRIDLEPRISLFYEYQQLLLDQYKNTLIRAEINKLEHNTINVDELVENINKINNESMIIKQNNKVTPDEMIKIVRSNESIINFDRFKKLNEKLRIKKNTINVIAARPSEGKSALALNLFCDLAKDYKCIYFNMEMTEREVYERMLGIESDFIIKDVISPPSDYVDSKIKETANKIYNYNYQVINGSKTVQSIRNKIIKEQRDEHCIIFIDYTGYIVGKQGQNDRERIGEAVRELNNTTKDYNCTIFLIAQINRNGSDTPTMQDLKDSGELEQSADTIILINDKNKENNDNVKQIDLLIPKCRGGKRNVMIPITFDKTRQKMIVL